MEGFKKFMGGGKKEEGKALKDVLESTSTYLDAMTVDQLKDELEKREKLLEDSLKVDRMKNAGERLFYFDDQLELAKRIPVNTPEEEKTKEGVVKMFENLIKAERNKYDPGSDKGQRYQLHDFGKEKIEKIKKLIEEKQGQSMK